MDANNVYASFGPSGVVALTHEGELLWRRSVGTKTAGFGAAASPILFEDLVIMNASIEDDAVYAVEKATGEVRWRTADIDRAWTTPTIVNLNNGNADLAINRLGAEGERFNATPAIVDDQLLLRSDKKLYCIRSGERI